MVIIELDDTLILAPLPYLKPVFRMRLWLGLNQLAETDGKYSQSGFGLVLDSSTW